MSPRYMTVAGALIAMVVCLVRPAAAQLSPDEPAGGGVAGTASAVLERQPTVLRLQLMISADGKDTKEALSKLKEKEAAAKAKLDKLAATEGSVAFSDPLPVDATQQQQAQRMMLMRSGRAPGPAKNNAPAANLYTTLKAEWPLSSKTVEDLLIESQDLETKIKGADLSGTNEKLSAAEQQELAEEAQGLNNGDGQPNPRDPVFLFAAKISIQDRDAARGDAFKKARADAESLARAAGGQLGSIRLLAAQAASTSNPFADPTYGGYRQRGPYMPAGPSDDDPLEAVGPQPAKVTYRVTVYVSFALK